jgi:hypothetical protein
MFIGHYAVALGAKKVSPRASLGTLLLASQFIDLLWPIFLLLGLEHVRIAPGNTVFTPLDFYDYPISHSLLAVLGWSLGFGLLHYAVQRSGRNALILGALVLSHWVLDFISHRPDLPLMPGMETRVGLGLWNSFVASVVVETALFVVGAFLYLRATKARDRVGQYALWAFLLLLVVLYVANMFGPPPPSVQALAVVAFGQWLFVLWGYWIDKHRTA